MSNPKNTVAPLDASRVQSIAGAIRNACAPIVDADISSKEAKDLAATLREQGLGVREHIMSNVAKLSREGNWDAREVSAGAAAAAKMGNDLTDKSMATFIGQVKLAAMPLVRDNYDHITTVVNGAWDDEREQLAIDKASPAPLAKAWKRKFHTLVHVCKVISDGSRTFVNKDALVNYARECDPDHNAEKVQSRIDTLVKNILVVYADFPAEDLKLAADYLTSIDVKDLTEARAQKLAGMGAGRLETVPAGGVAPQSQTGTSDAPKPPAPPAKPRGKATQSEPAASTAPAAPSITTDADLEALINGENIIQPQLLQVAA